MADTGNGVRKITPAGLVSTVTAGKAHFSNAQCLALDSLDNLYVLDGDVIRKMTPAGEVTALPKTALRDGQGNFIHPTSMAVDQAGRLFLVDETANAVWVVLPHPALSAFGVKYKNIAMDGPAAQR